jgi:hypothetical protein
MFLLTCTLERTGTVHTVCTINPVPQCAGISRTVPQQKKIKVIESKEMRDFTETTHESNHHEVDHEA